LRPPSKPALLPIHIKAITDASWPAKQ
jgi:hypothetical protein